MNAQNSLAAVLHEPGRLELVERPAPEPGPGEVLVEVGACAICGSDFHLIDGHVRRAKYPVVPGHELMGVVSALGPGAEGVEVGARACIENHVHCGECYFCRMGRVNLCNNSRSIGMNVDGGYSRHVIAPAKSVLPLPDALDDATASVMQTLGTGYHVVMNRARLEAGESVAIIGMGPVGLCALAAAKYAGARVIAIDAVADRLEVAREMGADETIDVRAHDSVAAVQDFTGGHGADAVLEVVGGAQNKTMEQAFEMARKGGRIVVVGAFSVDAPIPLEHLQHLEKEIIGSRGHPDTFEVCIDLAARGELNVKPMITHRIPLSMVHRGIEMMRERKDGAIKVVLIPNQES